MFSSWVAEIQLNSRRFFSYPILPFLKDLINSSENTVDMQDLEEEDFAISRWALSVSGQIKQFCDFTYTYIL